MHGDADIARVGALVADPARARVLMALGDGRALPATVLAEEAGVAASTTSAHLAKLVKGGLLTVERHGRHRYFRLAGPQVADLLEALASCLPAGAGALAAPGNQRAGASGTPAPATTTWPDCSAPTLMTALLERGLLTGGDGVFDPGAAHDDRLSAPGFDLDYTLTPRGVEELAGLRHRLRRAAAEAAADPATASTGASSATTSPELSERRSPSGCSSWIGCSGPREAGRCGSPTTGHGDSRGHLGSRSMTRPRRQPRRRRRPARAA